MPLCAPLVVELGGGAALDEDEVVDEEDIFGVVGGGGPFYSELSAAQNRKEF